MSLSTLNRRIEDARKTRNRFIEKAKVDREYLKREEWHKSFIYHYITAAQKQNKHLEKGAVGRTLEKFWGRRQEYAQLSKLQVIMAFNTKLRRLEQDTLDAKKAGIKKRHEAIVKKREGEKNPDFHPSPGSRKGSSRVEPHTIVSTRRSRTKGPRVLLKKTKGRLGTPRIPRSVSIPTNPDAPADHPLPDDSVPSSTLTAIRAHSPDVTLRIRGGGKKKPEPARDAYGSYGARDEQSRREMAAYRAGGR